VTRWLEGCDCDGCHEAQNDAAKARFRRNAQARLPRRGAEAAPRAIYNGKPFRTVLRDLGLTSNQVWGLAKTDREWSEKLETAPTTSRRDDLRHGTMPPTCTAVSAAGAGSTSPSGWPLRVSTLDV
jgi:hypothetical protein